MYALFVITQAYNVFMSECVLLKYIVFVCLVK